MDPYELLIWILAGLIAGWLVDASQPTRSLGRLCSALGVALVGSIAGGVLAARLFEGGPPAFLAAVCLGTLCALGAVYLPRRSPPTRYHT
jgi:uncharacterized membrane protein YeaQ/YmgE (transglycosylase-associated protein family)